MAQGTGYLGTPEQKAGFGAALAFVWAVATGSWIALAVGFVCTIAWAFAAKHADKALKHELVAVRKELSDISAQLSRVKNRLAMEK